MGHLNLRFMAPKPPKNARLKRVYSISGRKAPGATKLSGAGRLVPNYVSDARPAFSLLISRNPLKTHAIPSIPT